MKDEMISLSDNELLEEEAEEEVETINVSSASKHPDNTTKELPSADQLAAEEKMEQPQVLMRKNITLRPQTPEPVSLSESESEEEESGAEDRKQVETTPDETSSAQEVICGEDMLSQSIADTADCA